MGIYMRVDAATITQQYKRQSKSNLVSSIVRVPEGIATRLPIQLNFGLTDFPKVSSRVNVGTSNGESPVTLPMHYRLALSMGRAAISVYM